MSSGHYSLSVLLVLHVLVHQTDGKRAPWLPPTITHDKIWTSPSESSTSSMNLLPPEVGIHGGSLQGSQQQQQQQQQQQRPVQEPVQSQQILQDPMEKQITWSFPTMPKEPVEPEAPHEAPKQRQPVEPEAPHEAPKQRQPVESVAVRCGEADVLVEVHQNFYGTGQLIEPADIFLGDCPVSAVDVSDQILIFESELHKCGSRFEMKEDELLYTFNLVYQPKAVAGAPILRTAGATVDIECRYPRVHNVSSNDLKPTWVPFVATKTAEEVLVFGLMLMTDDYKFERSPSTLFLGSMLHLEASVIQYNHVPLRVFVHSCVATAAPDVNSLPRYQFIENHGCLVDAKVTASRSQFLPRAEDDKLRFKLEAFRFAEEDGSSIYIACKLVATTAMTKTDHKACSYSADRWTSADGNDDECLCCDSTCGTSREDEQWESEAHLGPLAIRDQ
uniref:Zona pellucida sperm-binding protein 3 n=1 Tax=Engraulis japonicus TaxID=42892 RepID=K4Q256_ENGJA|nr:egg envelope protein [Engraulis japonicus]